MKTIVTLVIDGPNVDDWHDVYDCVSDVNEGRVDGVITVVSTVVIDGDIADDIDPYDGDPCNEVADLATEFDIVPADGCRGLKEDYVYADVDFNNGRQVKIAGPISWVLPILRASHGLAR